MMLPEQPPPPPSGPLLGELLEAAAREERDDPPTRPRPGVRVLLVEDELGLCHVLTRLLAGEGYEVQGVGTAAEALAFSRETGRRWDLLITDIRLPGMDGLELVRRFRQLHPGVPVLCISGLLPPEECPVALRPREFLHKPFTGTHFVSRIVEALAGVSPAD